MNDVSSHTYLGPLAKTVNSSSPFAILFLDILSNNIISLNPETLIIPEDFNEKCSKRYSFDRSDNIGKELDTITSTAGYSQIIDKTIFQTIFKSCIDLIFTSNLSIIVDSSIQNSLCSSCNRDIIYGKSYFRVPFLPPHFWTI